MSETTLIALAGIASTLIGSLGVAYLNNRAATKRLEAEHRKFLIDATFKFGWQYWEMYKQEEPAAPKKAPPDLYLLYFRELAEMIDSKNLTSERIKELRMRVAKMHAEVFPMPKTSARPPAEPRDGSPAG